MTTTKEKIADTEAVIETLMKKHQRATCKLVEDVSYYLEALQNAVAVYDFDDVEEVLKNFKWTLEKGFAVVEGEAEEIGSLKEELSYLEYDAEEEAKERKA